jgi:hypothetical protein
LEAGIQRKLNWPQLFSKAALLARKVLIPVALVIGIPTLWLLRSDPWNTFLTALGTVLAFVAIWLTLEIFRIGEEFSEGQQKLIREVHKTILTNTKAGLFQELRRKYDFAKANATEEDDKVVNFWHFMWRFETYSSLTISLIEPSGFAEIRILGSSVPAFEINYEKMSVPIYTVEVIRVDDNKAEQNKTLKLGRAYCWCLNGTAYISNDANEIELYQPMRKFLIVGLGPARGGVVAPKPKNFKRMRDLSDPSESNEDQG